MLIIGGSVMFKVEDMDIVNYFGQTLGRLGLKSRPAIFKMNHMVIFGNFIGEQFKYIRRIEDDEY